MVSSFTPGFDANAIFLKLEKQAEKWSQQQAEYESLDVHTKPILHTLMLEYQQSGMSRVASETHAYADNRYKTHVDGVVVAHQRANHAKATYQNSLKWADLKQSEETSARTLVTRS
jgi:hypothetical protein|tara:strand:- start:356 stop:703 length:348 start_codon:yes stop_codon:yes gene_type:complete